MIATIYTFAGWIVFDLKLLIFIVAISIFSTVSLVSLLFKGRKWYDYVSFSLAVFCLIFFILIIALNEIVDYPVFKIEDIFLIE